MTQETGMPAFRKEIDVLDRQIVALMAQREKIVHAVGEYKAKNGIHPVDLERKKVVTENFKKLAQEQGLDVDFAVALYELIYNQAIKIEETYR
ncbi:chorismate mutase [Elusimicrobium posterum]|uniref:chorismate mutase n=1 Tax=Elusimicrobium posterum TaxID=3116653 RepID=UPI003C7655BA